MKFLEINQCTRAYWPRQNHYAPWILKLYITNKKKVVQRNYWIMRSFKAFDCGYRSETKALRNRGISSSAVLWLLYWKKTVVSVNEHLSGLEKVFCSVPQGSVIGPLLFISYINDLTQKEWYLLLTLRCWTQM